MIQRYSFKLFPIILFHLFLDSIQSESIFGEDLKFKYKPLDILAVEKEDVMFSCKIIGTPTPVVTWSKSEGVIPERAQISENSLRIDNVIMSDEGEYFCHGTNSYGTIKASAKLTVQSVPIFVQEPQNKTVVKGDTVSLTCTVSGKPQPTLFWAKEGTRDLFFPGHKSSNNKIQVNENGELKIYNVQKPDEGFYFCSGLNSAGSPKSQAYLKVVEKGTPVDKNVGSASDNYKSVGSHQITVCRLFTVSLSVLLCLLVKQ